MNTASKTEIPVLVVFGATASGKTGLAESLFACDSPSPFAARSEIISADSMQVYKGMDIGTAKPDSRLLPRLPHHLIDIFFPDKQFTSGEFVRRADEACADIFSRGKLPVILGGTAFYIRNFLYGLPKTPQADDKTRQALKNELKRKGALAMHDYLAQLDPQSANRIHLHDEYRILRALEVCVASGRPLSSFALEEKTRAPYNFCVLALERPREELNRRIDERVDNMFERGLESEVKKLVAAGYGQQAPGMQAIGYREFFDADFDPEKARALIKNDSKKYAKRQQTFFKTIAAARWIAADDAQTAAVAVEQLIKCFAPARSVP